MPKTYSNPRTHATVTDWPSGGKRVTAIFYIEADPKRGERAVRVTTGAPKKLTYAPKVRIVDGDDGRTYIAELTAYGHVSIMRSDMKLQEESIHTHDPRYGATVGLFRTYEEDEKLSMNLIDIALGHAREGQWEQAWETAKLDPLLNADATREKWEAWARTKINPVP